MSGHTHSCGHPGTDYVITDHRSAVRWMRWDDHHSTQENCLCIDCWGESNPEGEETYITRVRLAAPDEWLDQAVRAVEATARSYPRFTTDDVWDRLRVTPPEPRALGAVMRDARRSGWAEPLDSYQRSRRPECHGRPIRVWRSRLYGGPAYQEKLR